MKTLPRVSLQTSSGVLFTNTVVSRQKTSSDFTHRNVEMPTSISVTSQYESHVINSCNVNIIWRIFVEMTKQYVAYDRCKFEMKH